MPAEPLQSTRLRDDVPPRQSVAGRRKNVSWTASSASAAEPRRDWQKRLTASPWASSTAASRSDRSAAPRASARPTISSRVRRRIVIVLPRPGCCPFGPSPADRIGGLASVKDIPSRVVRFCLLPIGPFGPTPNRSLDGRDRSSARGRREPGKAIPSHLAQPTRSPPRVRSLVPLHPRAARANRCSEITGTSRRDRALPATIFLRRTSYIHMTCLGKQTNRSHHLSPLATNRM
jgi:hypothetical protein